ncbi:amidohydrolase [Lunatibacter salilacus]|uniref:amidohydrolase n=1 Tax=Lunatibacter salilacus TaxID=2483804 RepID=UPI00131DA1AD|nr:amidohydrolase [Lunatibacter salilacus]
MENLKVAGIQSSVYWHDRGSNLAMFEEKIWELESAVDLIVLPEMFTTGFTMEAERVAEHMNMDTTKWMKQMASQTKAVITGSVVIREGEKYFNRLLWATPDGEVLHYDKRHLFRMAKEDAHYNMGTTQPIFDLKGWKILPQVCFDLRFPVWSRNRATKEGGFDYDFSFYVASWPAARSTAWDVLLPARAVENWCYTLGLNRVGTDGNEVAYNGHSGLYDFKGNRICFGGETEMTLLFTLNADQLHEYREKFPAWKDADAFRLG